MFNNSWIPLLFMLITTLHNIEEGLWLPQWSRYAKKFYKPVDGGAFHFALIIVTALAYLISGLFIFFPDNEAIKYIFIGYVSTMLLNVIFPHLAATVIMKNYVPGIITGILVNLPLNSLIIRYMIKIKAVSLFGLVFSTLITSFVIVFLLPFLFKLGSKGTNYDKNV